jgi:hypothetical protein
MAGEAELIEGIELALGGKKWIVPPLNFAALRRLHGDIDALQSTNGPVISGDGMDRIVRVVTAALQRNYPVVTAEQVDELLDLGNAGRALMAVMGISGMQPAGEPPALQPSASQSTGTQSTDSSSTPQAGPSSTSIAT